MLALRERLGLELPDFVLWGVPVTLGVADMDIERDGQALAEPDLVDVLENREALEDGEFVEDLEIE